MNKRLLLILMFASVFSMPGRADPFNRIDEIDLRSKNDSSTEVLAADDVFRAPDEIRLSIYEWDIEAAEDGKIHERKRTLFEQIPIDRNLWRELADFDWCFQISKPSSYCVHYERYRFHLTKRNRYEELVIYTCGQFTATCTSRAPIDLPKEAFGRIKALVEITIQSGSGRPKRVDAHKSY